MNDWFDNPRIDISRCFQNVPEGVKVYLYYMERCRRIEKNGKVIAAVFDDDWIVYRKKIENILRRSKNESN